MIATKSPPTPWAVLRAIARQGAQKLPLVVTSTTLLWLIIGLGITLRGAQYLANRSLWIDEALLALNLLHRSFAQLWRPLEHDQVAPIGFLMAEKLAVTCLGTSEYALRFFPFVAGLAALPLFSVVARWCLTPTARLISVILFALSGPLIYYASEVKPYSSDVTVAVLLCGLALRAVERGRVSRREILLVGGSGAMAVWCSAPALFILLGIGVSLAWWCIARRAWRELGPLALVGVLWMASGIAVYVAYYHQVDTRELVAYWHESFMPLPPRSLADVKRLGETFYSLFADPVGLRFTPLAVMVFLIGCAVLFSEHKAKVGILLSPLGFAVIASGFHLYPVSGRLVLFIVPAMLICIAEGIRYVLKQTDRFGLITKALVIACIIVPPLEASVSHLLKTPVLRQEIRPVMHYLQTHWHEGDTLYVYYGAIPAFQYYRERLGLAAIPALEGIGSRNHWPRYLDELDKLRGRPRVWVLLSNVYRGGGIDERILFLEYLDYIGTRLDAITAYGAEAYLYNLETSTRMHTPGQ